MSSALPRISIVIPVLNRADMIERTFRSVLDQAYPNLELIVMDGASTDGTVDIIKRYAEHIAYWQSERDGNTTNAMNCGIAKATGDLIAVLMADDWYEKGVLHAIGQAYCEHPDNDMFTCGGRIVQFNAAKQRYETKVQYTTQAQLALTLANICFADVSVICCRFIKRSFYQRIGNYVPYDKNGDYVFSNDKEFLLRAVLASARDYHVNVLGHNYLAHPGSCTFGNNRANIIRMCREHMMMAEKFLQSAELTLKQRWQLCYWYNDQAARLLAYNILDRRFQKGLNVIFENIRQYPLMFPISFLLTSLRISFRKIKDFKAT